MFRTAAAFLVLMLASSQVFAQSTLPTVEVTGMRIGWTTLCTGSACADLFNAPEVIDYSGMYDELSADAPQQEDNLACAADSTTREGGVWAAYQAALLLKHRNKGPLAMAYAANEDRGNQGSTLTITFSNGSTGEYRRTDSQFGGSHGFDETKAPDCSE